MLFFGGALGLLFLALWIFCIIDVITTPEPKVRHLPKVVWVLIVILLIDIGSIAWLTIGRTWGANGAAGDGDRRATGERGLRPVRPVRTRAVAPDDDPEFIATLRARAEEQRRRAQEAKQADEGPTDEPTS